jgi:hypothetical protein
LHLELKLLCLQNCKQNAFKEGAYDFFVALFLKGVVFAMFLWIPGIPGLL